MNSKAKTEPKVTVGLCVKDAEKTVKEAINSVIRQTYPSELMELIVVDGCSRDKTLSIVKSMLSKTYIQRKVYSDEGVGLGCARQMVVVNASGKYIIFIDGDVKVPNDFVQKQVEFMEQNPEVGAAVGRYTYEEGTLVSTLLNLYHHIDYNQYMGNDATIFRFEALRQVGGFDENIKGALEDLDLIVRIQAKGWISSVNEKARFYHNSKRDFRDNWVEQIWFGYGAHYFSHKHKHSSYRLWHNVPLVSFFYGLKLLSKAYELTHRKISFLIPLLLALRKIPWWFGFVKAHADGYGHEIS